MRTALSTFVEPCFTTLEVAKAQHAYFTAQGYSVEPLESRLDATGAKFFFFRAWTTPESIKNMKAVR